MERSLFHNSFDKNDSVQILSNFNIQKQISSSSESSSFTESESE